MRCPKCKESMKVDVDMKKYVCEKCGKEIEWHVGGANDTAY